MFNVHRVVGYLHYGTGYHHTHHPLSRQVSDDNPREHLLTSPTPATKHTGCQDTWRKWSAMSRDRHPTRGTYSIRFWTYHTMREMHSEGSSGGAARGASAFILLNINLRHGDR